MMASSIKQSNSRNVSHHRQCIISRIGTGLRREWTVSHKTVYRFAYFLLSLPVLIFLLTHLKWFFALPAAGIFLFGLACSFRRIARDHDETYKLPVGVFLVFIFLALLLSWLAGQGGYFPQKYDHIARNPVLHDLIFGSWPVVYKQFPGSRLVYYYCYWLVPASAAKLFLGLGDRAAMEAGQFFLFMWTSLWIFTLFLLCSCKLRIQSLRKAVLLALIFFAFSGMDCIGSLLMQSFNDSHIEWWIIDRKSYDGLSYICSYSSHFAQLAWVFNQSLPAWLCSILIFGDDKIWHHIPLVALCLAYAPFPAVGLAGIIAFLYLSVFVDKWCHNQSCGEFIRKSFNSENTAVCISVVPIIILFYFSNNTVSDSADQRIFKLLITDFYAFFLYILFCLLEFALLALLLFKENKHNKLFYAIFAELMFFPVVQFISRDSFLKCSVPGLCILSLFLMKFLLRENNDSSTEAGSLLCRKYRKITLGIMILLGSVTPFIEIYSSAKIAFSKNTMPWRRYEYYSFATSKALDFNYLFNYLAKGASEKIFFKYLARSSKPFPNSEEIQIALSKEISIDAKSFNIFCLHGWKWPNTRTWADGVKSKISIPYSPNQPYYGQPFVRITLNFQTFSKQEQYLSISMMGEELYSGKFKGKLTIAIRCPLNKVHAKKLYYFTLDLKMPNAIADRAIMKSRNKRDFGIRFDSIKFDLQNEPVGRICKALPLDSDIATCLNTLGQNLLCSGWNSPEPWGTWSEGHHAEIVIPYASNQPYFGKSFVRITLKFQPFFKEQRLSVSMMGKELYSGKFKSESSVAIRCPLDEVHAKKMDYFVLDLKIPDAVAPSAVAKSQDNRALGIGLHSIRFGLPENDKK